MKKIHILFIIIGVIVLGGYFYIRYALNTGGGFQPAVAKEVDKRPKSGESDLDLRPKIIKKLQQLVKDGSGGLYNLSIHEVNPDVIAGRLDLGHVLLSPDSSVINQFEKTKNLPNDIFKVEIDSIHFDGVNVPGIVTGNSIDLDHLIIEHPIINVYHKSQEYNNHKGSDTSKVFQRIMSYMNRISVKDIQVKHAKLFDHNLSTKTTKTFEGIAITGENLLIDSSTQCSNDRFCFTKSVNLTLRDYKMMTNDHFYTFKVAKVSISTDKQLMSFQNVDLIPVYSKQEFQKHIKIAKQRFTLTVPSVNFHNIDWWSLINGERFHAEEADVNNPKLNLYLNLSLPSAPVAPHGFPQQLLMQIPVPVHVNKTNIRGLNVEYEEYHPQSGKSGIIYFDGINGTVINTTNNQDVIKNKGVTTVSAAGRFMHFIPISAHIVFDLKQFKTGQFSATIDMGKFDASRLQNITEPMGLFLIKRGTVEKAHADVSANNYNGNGKVTLIYNDLHITPVKKDDDRASGYKKKSALSFVANTLVIKDENPSHENLRQPEVSMKRDPKESFFNFIWKIALSGILKTTGIPEKYAH